MNLNDLVSTLHGNLLNYVSFYAGKQEMRRSFHELHNDVHSVVEALREAGLQAGSRVGAMMSNSYDWVVLDLAVMTLECQLVAFPQEISLYPPEELANTYGLALLFVESESEIKEFNDDWICVYSDFNAIRSVRSRKNHPVFSDRDEFTLHFSSGSSGSLKCLVGSRRGTELFIQGYRDIFIWLESDVMLAFMPLSSYQQRLMLYGALGFPHNIVFVSPGELSSALALCGSTVFVGPPVFFEQLEKRLLAQADDSSSIIAGLKKIAPSIRYFITGMAPIRRSTVEFFKSAGVPLYVAYSLNEAGTVSANTPESNKPGSVGRLFPSTEVTLAEDGEILVRKLMPLSSRYLHRSDNQNTFLSDGLIATGDLGEFDEDGFLYLIGRKKNVIITSSGHKINPESIERQIEAWPLVNHAVVFGSEEPYLRAVISYASSPNTFLEEDIRRRLHDLNKTLGVSSFIGSVVFTAVPFTVQNGLLTRNLKLDRQRIFKEYAKEWADVEGRHGII